MPITRVRVGAGFNQQRNYTRILVALCGVVQRNGPLVVPGVRIGAGFQELGYD